MIMKTMCLYLGLGEQKRIIAETGEVHNLHLSVADKSHVELILVTCEGVSEDEFVSICRSIPLVKYMTSV